MVFDQRSVYYPPHIYSPSYSLIGIHLLPPLEYFVKIMNKNLMNMEYFYTKWRTLIRAPFRPVSIPFLAGKIFQHTVFGN